jgi:hypothetical protein
VYVIETDDMENVLADVEPEDGGGSGMLRAVIASSFPETLSL